MRRNWPLSSGKAGGVTEERALDFVAGCAIFNDVTARDYQKRTTQWTLGKTFDTFGPMGPALKSPIFLQPGDIVTIRIERIGEWSTPVIAEIG